MSTATIPYGIKKNVDLSYDVALDRIREELQKRGFGILWETDLRDKLKERLGVDIRRYMILGACNPAIAHRALQAETDIGLLMPCNVIVYDDGPTRSVVAVLDPGGMVAMTGNEALGPLARDARERLEAAIRALE